MGYLVTQEKTQRARGEDVLQYNSRESYDFYKNALGEHLKKELDSEYEPAERKRERERERERGAMIATTREWLKPPLKERTGAES